MTLLRICFLTSASIIAVGGTLIWRGGRKKDPDQQETLRRQRISAEGRITDGTVLEVQGFDPGAGDSRQLVHYVYNIAGVQYECAQDVTPLCQLLDLRSRGIRLSTSVKYDPQHPSNSIVAAESWCGLRAVSHASLPLQESSVSTPCR